MGNELMRCRLKYGDVEFAVEGTDPDLRKKIDDMYGIFIQAVSKGKPSLTVKGTPSEAKPTRKGGRRPPFIKNALLGLIEKEPQWMVDKSPEQVTDKLRTEYGAVGARGKPVNNALIRLFRDGYLTRKEVEGKYVYSITALRTAS